MRTAELVGRAVGTLASVLDFNHCYIAGSVALGFGDEFFDVANKSARSMARLPYSEHLEIVPIRTRRRRATARRGARRVAADDHEEPVGPGLGRYLCAPPG